MGIWSVIGIPGNPGKEIHTVAESELGDFSVENDLIETFFLVMLRFGFIDFDSIFRSTIRSRFDFVSIFLRSAHLC